MHQTATAKIYGQFQNDLLQGWGKDIYNNRETFIGNHLGGRREGSGFLLKPKGQAYIGEWKHDELVNNSLRAIKDNYIGETKNGVREGQGTMEYPDGDLMNWKGVMAYNNKDVYSGIVLIIAEQVMGLWTMPIKIYMKETGNLI